MFYISIDCTSGDSLIKLLRASGRHHLSAIREAYLLCKLAFRLVPSRLEYGNYRHYHIPGFCETIYFFGAFFLKSIPVLCNLANKHDSGEGVRKSYCMILPKILRWLDSIFYYCANTSQNVDTFSLPALEAAATIRGLLTQCVFTNYCKSDCVHTEYGVI